MTHFDILCKNGQAERRALRQVLKCETGPVEVSLACNFSLAIQFVQRYQIGFFGFFQDLSKGVVGAQNGHKILLEAAVIAWPAVDGDAKTKLKLEF